MDFQNRDFIELVKRTREKFNVSIEEGRIPGIPVLTIRDEATDALRMAGAFEAMTEATLSTLLDEVDTAATLRQMWHFKG